MDLLKVIFHLGGANHVSPSLCFVFAKSLGAFGQDTESCFRVTFETFSGKVAARPEIMAKRAAEALGEAGYSEPSNSTTTNSS